MPARLARAALAAAVLAATLGTGLAQDVGADARATWQRRVGFVEGTDWRSYLLIAPGAMGPNALPVAPTLAGRVDSVYGFRVSATAYDGWLGDRAQDLTAELRVPFGRRASLRVRYVALERFRLSDRFVAEHAAPAPADSAGVTTGDVHVEGLFQVVRDRRGWPDIAIAVRAKTASGGGLEALRYTDTPGYAFDASFGKAYALARGARLRVFAAGGFFVWQRFGAVSPQNDAYTYAAGARLRRGAWSLRSELAGYSGWTELRDRPVVWRSALGWNGGASSGWAVRLNVDAGLRDWRYRAFGVGVGYAIAP